VRVVAMSCLYVIITQTAKLGYQPPSVTVSPPARQPAYEPPVRDAPLQEMVPEPLSTQAYHPGLMILQRETSHPAVNYNSAGSAVNSVPLSSVGVPRTKFEMTAPSRSITSPRVTDLSASGPDVRPVPVAMTTHTVATPAVVSAVTSAPHLTSFRPPVPATAAATVPVIRRRTSDKSHLPIAVGE